MTSSDHAFVVSGALCGQTLAAALRVHAGNLSWTDCRRLIAGRRVRINGAVCLDDARRLREGDSVDVLGASRAPPPPAERGVRVVHVDADLIVVEKPAGLQTVRRIEERNWSVARKAGQPVLQEVVEQLLKVAGGQSRHVRAVHRLDRDTSGLMMFALSAPTEQELIRRFSRHQIQRVYRAVVQGVFSEPRTVSTSIVRDRGDGIRGSVNESTQSSDARQAVTHIRPLERIGKDFTIVECRLETGRTHQIRIHLAEIGHMLCGERIYVRPTVGAGIVEDRSGAPRQVLHSAELEFEHPVTGKPMKFESPWPGDLARWIESMRKR